MKLKLVLLNGDREYDLLATTDSTTVAVVALPTPAAPPVTWRPLPQAMTPIRNPKMAPLPTPVQKSTAKGTYMRSITISTTHGPGIKVDTAAYAGAAAE